jgi:hypothetical protein
VDTSSHQQSSDGTDGGMTRREREDLAKVVRLRERVAKSDTQRVAAERRADFEAQLAEQYDPMDEAWNEAHEAAQQAVGDLNARIAEQCEQKGIPKRYAPSAHMGWSSRGENYSAERRAELRQVASTRIAADQKAAKTEIERASAQVQTQLIAGGLDSAEARAFLESMPTAEALMPVLTIAEIKVAASETPALGRGRRR